MLYSSHASLKPCPAGFECALGISYNFYKGYTISGNVNFNIVWRWQDAFYWQNLFGNGIVPAYSTVDAQVTYRLPKLYFQYVGGPEIRGIYYLSVTVDGLWQ